MVEAGLLNAARKVGLEAERAAAAAVKNVALSSARNIVGESHEVLLEARLGGGVFVHALVAKRRVIQKI